MSDYGALMFWKDIPKDSVHAKKRVPVDLFLNSPKIYSVVFYPEECVSGGKDIADAVIVQDNTDDGDHLQGGNTDGFGSRAAGGDVSDGQLSRGAGSPGGKDDATQRVVKDSESSLPEMKILDFKRNIAQPLKFDLQWQSSIERLGKYVITFSHGEDGTQLSNGGITIKKRRADCVWL